jgi:hypothetical protein
LTPLEIFADYPAIEKASKEPRGIVDKQLSKKNRGAE